MPLSPSIWGQHLVLRSGPKEFRLLRLSRPVASTVRTERQTIQNLDMLAQATKKQTLPWTVLYRLSQAGMHTILKPNPNRNGLVTTRWQMGSYPVVSQIGMFYMQSACTCLYLYNAENGKYRQTMLNYLGDYYRGNAKALDVKKVFGMSPKELGQRITAYAKKITAR